MNDIDCLVIMEKSREHLIRCIFDDFRLNMIDLGDYSGEPLFNLINQLAFINQLEVWENE